MPSEDESWLHRAGWLLLLAAVFLVPLVQSNVGLKGVYEAVLTYDSFGIPKAATLATLVWSALACWALDLRTGRPRVRVHVSMVTAIAIVAWWTLATVTSVSPSLSVVGERGRAEGLAIITTYGAMFFLVFQYVGSVARLRAMARAIALSGGLVSLYGLAQFLNLDPLPWTATSELGHRVFSTLGNPDILGAYLSLVAPLALGLALSERDERWRYVLYSAGTVSLSALVLTLVRSAWVAGAIGLFVCGLAAVRKGGVAKHVKKGVALGAVGILVSAGIAQLVPQAGLTLFERIAGTFGPESSLSQRLYLWKAAVAYVADRPIAGYGPATFGRVFGREPGDAFFLRWPPYSYVVDSPHNFYLDAAVSVGVVGAVLVTALLGQALFSSARRAFSREGGEASLVVAALWSAAVAWGVAMAAVPNQVGLGMWLWVLAAALMTSSARTVEIARPAFRVIAYATAVAAVTGAVWGMSWALADNRYTVASSQPTPRMSDRVLGQATAVNPLAQEYWYARGYQQTAALVSLARQGAEADQLAPCAAIAVSRFRDAVAHDRWDLKSRLGLMTALNEAAMDVPDAGYAEQALDESLETVALWPRDPQVLLQRGYALRGAADYRAAEAVLEDSVRLDPTFTETWTRLAEVREKQGEEDAALAAYRRAAVLDSANSEAVAGAARLAQ